MPEPQPWSHDRRDVRDSFDRAASSYDAAAVLQHEVGRRLLERLEWMRLEPRVAVDLGCGTGRQSAGLSERFPETRLVGLDLAPAMLAEARRRVGPGPHWICGDLGTLPLAERSVDLLFSNLALQWCLDPAAVFAELHRVLRPGGLLLFTTFGPDTLGELRASWAEVDDRNHVNAFFDLHDLGDALLGARFADPVMDCEHITLTYPDVLGLMRDLKAIGAHNVTAGRPRGLTGRRALATLADAYATFRREDGTLPATYEVVYGHAWRAPADTGERAVPVGALRRAP
ncbi:MAG: malonyl-ACP O-methyltransferase BioC [Gammaproteobacteria bacterium]|nr:malonyl-ACP O-methyltransferase BioC [Gammaproteobacteria bacterium]